jgi:phage tail-like protein
MTNNVLPLAKFQFQVEWDSRVFIFEEVVGLNTETQLIEYRRPNSLPFATTKMPGINKQGNITLKKGIVKSDNKFWDWLNEIKMNTIKRKSITIKLLDEAGKPTMIWSLTNAWPTKITGTDLKSDGNEVFIGSIEIVHEGITIKECKK